MSTLDKSKFAEEIRSCAADLGREGVTALGRLHDLTAARLLRYTLAIIGNPDDAEDAVQAAMVRIALKPRALADAHYPWPYFLKVARNEALNIIRRKTPLQVLSSFIDSWTAPPVAVWEDDELRQMVGRALRKLPSAQSEVVVLKIWEEMTFAEIADVLGESPNTVASRYRYALEKLTRQLETYRHEVLYD